MIAFTILGLVIFWCWCFQIGYLLAFVAQWVGCVVQILWLERKVRRDVDVFAGWVAALGKETAA